MRVECPHCAHVFEAADRQGGEVVSCPACAGQTRLPEPPPAAAGTGWSPETAGSVEECSGPDWERRRRIGWWPAFWGTTRGVLFDPARTFDRASRIGFGEAFIYLLVCNYIGVVAAIIYQAVFQGLQIAVMASQGGGEVAAAVGIFAVLMVFGILVGPAIAAGMQFVTALITHLGLMIMRGANQPYEATFRVTAYSAGATALLMVIPLCGNMIAGIWGLVATVIGLSRVHRIEWWRALLGVLLIPVIATVAIVALIVLAIVLIAAANS